MGPWEEVTRTVPWDVKGRRVLWQANPALWDDILERLRMTRTSGCQNP